MNNGGTAVRHALALGCIVAWALASALGCAAAGQAPRAEPTSATQPTRAPRAVTESSSCEERARASEKKQSATAKELAALLDACEEELGLNRIWQVYTAQRELDPKAELVLTRRMETLASKWPVDYHLQRAVMSHRVGLETGIAEEAKLVSARADLSAACGGLRDVTRWGPATDTCLTAIDERRSARVCNDQQAFETMSRALQQLRSTATGAERARVDLVRARVYHSRRELTLAVQAYAAVDRGTTVEPMRALAIHALLDLLDALADFATLEALDDRWLSDPNFALLGDTWLRRKVIASKIDRVLDRTNGDSVACVRELDPLALKYPDVGAPSETALFNVGHCYLRLGQKDKALERWQQLKQRYPKSGLLGVVRSLGADL